MDAFVDAALAVGLRAGMPKPGDEPADLVLDVDGRSVLIQLEVMATATLGELARRLRTWSAATRTKQDMLRILVADRIVGDAREELRRHGWGWLDLRGHLVLRAPGLVIDTDVPASSQRQSLRNVFSGKAGLEVSCSLLLSPDARIGVRGLARELSRSPSTVSEVMQALRREGLVDASGAPAIPELFWQLAGAWRPRVVALSSRPREGDRRTNEALHLGFDNVESSIGWALTDTLAAAAYGAPVGARSDHPPDFYVPDRSTERRAVMLLGESGDYMRREATIRVTPAPVVCARRVDAAKWSAQHWPLAHPLFVALDLARDPGRGHEILDDWQPAEPWRRVW